MLESSRVVERIDDATAVLHYVYKKVWPAAQRDSVIVVHCRRIADDTAADGMAWVTGIFSCEHPASPPNKDMVRVATQVTLLARTDILSGGRSAASPDLSRGDVATSLTYTACVNPGGWAPVSVVRAVSKREYPKFLKRLEKFILGDVQGKPLLL